MNISASDDDLQESVHANGKIIDMYDAETLLQVHFFLSLRLCHFP